MIQKIILTLVLFIGSFTACAAALAQEASLTDESAWRIGGKIHFEEQSAADYIGTVQINGLVRKTIKEIFSIRQRT